ncbi:MAG: hypothetical protein AAFO69_09615 [Bacteroidota bacterium]
MSAEEEQLLRFENYYLGRMNASERAMFERELKANREMAQAYAAYQLTIRTIKKEAFLADAREISAEEKQAGQHNWHRLPVSLRYIAGMAASLLILLVAAYLTGWFQSSDHLAFEQLYKPYPNVMQQRNIAQSKIDEAFVNYSTGNFAAALEDFQQVTSSNDTVIFYSAICSLSLGDPDKAIALLDSLYGVSSGFREQVNWYIALAYYKKEEYTPARRYLETIASGEYKYEESRTLLKSIK